MSKKILVIYESLSGNTETFVDYLINRVQTEMSSVSYTIYNMNAGLDYDLGDAIQSADVVLFGCYTWGNGVIPKTSLRVFQKYKRVLREKEVLLFGSGITIYRHFCGALDTLEKALQKEVPKIKFELTFEEEYEIINLEILNEFLKTNNLIGGM